jgi:uncharacterized protein (TIGR02246 family)
VPIREPAEYSRVFFETFNSGDLEAIMGLYEPGAALVPQAGAPPLTGSAALREALAGFLAVKGRMEGEARKVVQVGDVALVLTDWRLSGSGPDGTPLHMAATATDVLRRQPDGTWRIAIDNPFGTA